MKQLEIFNFEDRQVRIVPDEEGDPWFVASDVAKILGYREAYYLTRGLDADEKGPQIVGTPSGDQEMTVVSEAGLFSAILNSRIEGAKRFKRWVTHEVLPAIRKTGAYTAAPKSDDEIVQQALQITARRVQELEAANKALEPRATAWDTHVSANGDYSVAEAAKILARDHGIEIGRNRLFDFMSEIGWTYRAGSRNQWQAYQTQVDNGRLVLKMSPPFVNQRTGESELPAPTIRVTGKGIDALRKRLTSTLQVVS